MNGKLTKNNDWLLLMAGFTLGAIMGMFVGALLRYAAELLFRVVIAYRMRPTAAPDRQG